MVCRNDRLKGRPERKKILGQVPCDDRLAARHFLDLALVEPRTLGRSAAVTRRAPGSRATSGEASLPDPLALREKRRIRETIA